MKHLLKYIPLVFLMMVFMRSSAQDTTAVQEEPTTKYIEKAFYGTRVLNGHSLETTPKGRLDLRFLHRMGRLDQGFDDLFGLDQATFKFSLEYGILDWLMVGFGRSTLEKQWDGVIKAKVLRQSTGKRNMPLSLLVVAEMGINSTKWADPARDNLFTSRLNYTFQMIVGRKIGERIGLQVAPTLVHRNLVKTAEDHNDVFALGFGGRVRFSKRVAFTMEYYWVPKGQIYSPYNGAKVTDNLSAGVEILTGKHVFQVFLTNGTGMAENQFITQTTDYWFKGIHIGFNMTRLFTVAEY